MDHSFDQKMNHISNIDIPLDETMQLSNKRHQVFAGIIPIAIILFLLATTL